MKIALFTNTYLPHVGGVARSVKTLEDGCRRLGHEVRVIAPESDGAEESPDVLRVPAIQHFNGSDFSVRIPFPNVIREFIEDFGPDLIHSHHPFLLGDAAFREAWKMEVPIIFTHHTLYERYTHYVPLDSPALKRAAVQLSVEYCNLCDQIVAPSQSIADLLQRRGVTTPIRTIPTGIDTGFFAGGEGGRLRAKMGISPEARVIGHVGRLAQEKNLEFLAEAVAMRLEEDAKAVFLLVGNGDARWAVLDSLRKRNLETRIHAPGSLSGDDLAAAYAAMDWFVFASQSETQGIVLAEAMAAGKPVVALDGPGVREIVRDRENGMLLATTASARDFAGALGELMEDAELRTRCAENARKTAAEYDTDVCVRAMLDCYQTLVSGYVHSEKDVPMPWDRLMESIEIEWDLLSAKMSAAAAAMTEPIPATEVKLD